MGEKVVGNAVCQVRTSRACCSLNPCNCQKENTVERVEPKLDMNIITRADSYCMYLPVFFTDVNFFQSQCKLQSCVSTESLSPQFGSEVCVVRNTGSMLQRDMSAFPSVHLDQPLNFAICVGERDLLKLNVKCLIYLFKWCENDSQSFKGRCSSSVINFHEIWGHARDEGSKSVPQSHWHFLSNMWVKNKKHAKSYIFPWCISGALSAFWVIFLRLD